MTLNAQPSILLASASPRRRSLLALLGWGFSSLSLPVTEKRAQGETPASMATRLALEKAQKVAEKLPDTRLILGADTIVVKDDRVLGKPSSRDEARGILKELRDGWHMVITGIAIIDQRRGRVITDSCISHVPMREYSDGELESYLDSGSPMDKAGAYGIQDADFHPVPLEKLKGCYANVMGLPLCLVMEALHELEIEPPFDATHGCTKENVAECAVYPMIVEQIK